MLADQTTEKDMPLKQSLTGANGLSSQRRRLQQRKQRDQRPPSAFGTGLLLRALEDTDSVSTSIHGMQPQHAPGLWTMILYSLKRHDRHHQGNRQRPRRDFLGQAPLRCWFVATAWIR
eukprot:TRINITY_DN11641_c0_g2_i2.p1 TRINITY_DN11641_c0_g2~~TRINITY_DN11641_c0_g2_i2.p1  ORF type:complete len:118 (+),score=4.35 TRINITY_DN11641_c0_g2_i2:240-593(+)